MVTGYGAEHLGRMVIRIRKLKVQGIHEWGKVVDEAKAQKGL